MAETNETPVTDTATLERGLLEMQGLKTALHDAVDRACDERATADGHPVHPDMLAALLLLEAANVALQWGAARGHAPEAIETYFESLCRRARRGLHAQIVQVLNEQQKRIIT
jgi:hypothetical protein